MNTGYLFVEVTLSFVHPSAGPHLEIVEGMQGELRKSYVHIYSVQ